MSVSPGSKFSIRLFCAPILAICILMTAACGNNVRDTAKPVPIRENCRFGLYGFKLGQPMANVTAQLGKPDEEHVFEDGSIAYVYIYANHYVIFSIINKSNPWVKSIQLTGDNSEDWQMFDGLNLGISKDYCLSHFGKPDGESHAIDEITREDVENTIYVSYDYSRNFSFEFMDEKLTSIKIHLPYNIVESNIAPPASCSYLDAIHTRNLAGICALTAPEVIFAIGNDEFRPDKSLYEFYCRDEIIKVMKELEALNPTDMTEHKLYRTERNQLYSIFIFRKNGFIYYILQTHLLEGWIVEKIIRKPLETEHSI